MDPIYPHNFDLVGKPILYVNNTDGHYHIKVTMKSVAKYELDNVGIILNFNDKITSAVTKGANGPEKAVMNPRDVWSFDVDTTYTKAQGDQQFQYLKTLIGVI